MPQCQLDMNAENVLLNRLRALSSLSALLSKCTTVSAEACNNCRACVTVCRVRGGGFCGEALGRLRDTALGSTPP